MGDTKSIGIAYRDQDLDGSTLKNIQGLAMFTAALSTTQLAAIATASLRALTTTDLPTLTTTEVTALNTELAAIPLCVAALKQLGITA